MPSLNKPATSGSALSSAKAKSEVFSPSRNPAEALKNAGGMPPEKNEDAIFKENSPKRAPDVSRGT